MMGGIEQELAMLAPPDEQYGGDWADEYQAWRYWRLFTGILSKQIDSVGGIDFLDGSAFKKLLGSGGSLGLEGPYVAEISTSESIDAVTALNSLESMQAFLRKSFSSNTETIPGAFILCKTPAYLPLLRPGLERDVFRLGFHLNFNAALRPDQLEEFATIMAVLLPFLGASGGLSKAGFVLSPLGSTIKETLRYEQGLVGPPGIVEPRSYPTVLADRVAYGHEPRVHIPCFDAPVIKRSILLQFALCQLVLSLLLYEGSILGKHLANPALAYAHWSKCNLSDFACFERKFRLSDGSLGRHSELLDLIHRNLQDMKLKYVLHRTHEVALEDLFAGIRAWMGMDFAYLESHFDAFLKLRLYKEVLDTEGISFGLFNNVAVPLVYMTCKLGPDVYTLSRHEEGELSVLLETGGTEHKRKRLQRFMLDHGLSARDIRVFARIVHKLQSLELRLGEVFPEESPISDYDRRTWDKFSESLWGSACVGPNRSQKRGQLIGEMTRTHDKERLRADWSHIYYFRRDGDIDVIAMPDPYKPVANRSRLLRLDELSRKKTHFDFFEGLSFTKHMIDYYEEDGGENGSFL